LEVSRLRLHFAMWSRGKNPRPLTQDGIIPINALPPEVRQAAFMQEHAAEQRANIKLAENLWKKFVTKSSLSPRTPKELQNILKIYLAANTALIRSCQSGLAFYGEIPTFWNARFEKRLREKTVQEPNNGIPTKKASHKLGKNSKKLIVAKSGESSDAPWDSQKEFYNNQSISLIKDIMTSCHLSEEYINLVL
jgi:hypothetical protein